jgi:hypothetical protein
MSTVDTGSGSHRTIEAEAAATDVSPAAVLYGLDEHELTALREVGEQWARAVAGPRKQLRDLPVDPGLHRFPSSVSNRGADRFAAVDFVESDSADEISATPHADIPPSRVGAATSRLRRIAVGAPLTSSAVAHERMGKLIALPILSSDALSSVAYGPEPAR